jgi:hypothetical protein
MKYTKIALVVLLCAPLLAQTSRAQDEDWRKGHEHEHEHAHEMGGPGAMHGGWGGDIHRFHERDMVMWRQGRWYRGNHGGHVGWWWIVAGTWYYYPQPVYPAPDPFVPPMVVAPAAGEFWYYCRHPAGYYPYVAACRHWQAVPAQYQQAPAPQYQQAPVQYQQGPAPAPY